ncbi:MAG TPA: ATP-binding cassette domain-containing protein [Cytophagaceae bacterium]
MSEEILKALAQLYAIISKQDGGVTEHDREFVIKSFRRKINHDSATEYIVLYEELSGYGVEAEPGSKEKLTSVKDSVKTLGICRKINKTLTQKQKVVVLTDLFQMLKGGRFTPQRKQIIDTVSEAFNIDPKEHQLLEQFMLSKSAEEMDAEEYLHISQEKTVEKSNYLYQPINETLVFVWIKSVDMIFFRVIGNETYYLNGMLTEHSDALLFPSGSILKSGKGLTLFYSDIITHFHSTNNNYQLSFNVKGLEFKFPNGAIGLREINISEGPGKLIAIMGASGAGKTTLLNVLAGMEKPTSGTVLVNGIDLHKNHEEAQSVIGYVAQDDFLIEELTVYENLFYSARLCFDNLPLEAIKEKVTNVLDNLGLLHIKDLIVGNALQKSISGGQRKRLNIALELIREPSILFLDEPTSGLSSRDSENVIDLLKELASKGKLIFTVIHQPSSDIYKMFDKMLILDTGGYQVFYGNPIEAITYFKKISMHAEHEKGQCETCGNVNPEQVLNIIEEKVVDEYGNYTDKRKVDPKQWFAYFKENFSISFVEDLKESPGQLFQIPGKIKQWIIFTARDLKTKISNRQYLIVNFTEAPVLAFILAFIIRYNNTDNGAGYSFRYNENIPAYLLMSVVVAIFLGLSVSAEEIIRDRKILKRESLLNLSRLSYLSAKLTILFSITAIQSFTFLLVGNSILEIQGMFFSYWIILFSAGCLANVLGLLISSTFNSAVTVYILIPLLLIPQMILSGAMFSFEKINDLFKSEGKVPIVADFMISRWAFEALAVKQFMHNEYQKKIFKEEQIKTISSFNLVYLLPELKSRLIKIKAELNNKDQSQQQLNQEFANVVNEIVKRAAINPNITNQRSNLQELTPQAINTCMDLLEGLEIEYNRFFNTASSKAEQLLGIGNDEKAILELKNNYYNESLADFVRNLKTEKRIIDDGNSLSPNIDLVYFIPEKSNNPLNYRAHFCAPVKHFMGGYLSTFLFNILVLWTFCIILFVLLYYDVLKKLIDNKIASYIIKKFISK